MQELFDVFFNSINYYLRIFPFLLIGTFISKIILYKNPINFLRNKMKFFDIGKSFNILFLISFLSPMVSNILLSEFSKRKLYTERETIFVSLLLSFPKYVYHMLLTLPIIIPLLKFLALKYFSIIIITISIQVMLVLFIVRILKMNINRPFDIKLTDENANLKHIIIDTIKTFIKISAIFLIITLVIFYIYNVKYIIYVIKKLNVMNLDLNLLMIILSYIFKPILAYTIASSLLEMGYDENELLFTLILSSYVSFYFFAIKHLLPTYSAIFGIKLGGKIVIYSILIRTPIYMMMILILYKILYL